MRKSTVANRPGNIMAADGSMSIVPPAALRAARDIAPENDPLFRKEQKHQEKSEAVFADLNRSRTQSREKRVETRLLAEKQEQNLKKHALEDNRAGRRRSEYQGKRLDFGTASEKFSNRDQESDMIAEHEDFYEQHQSTAKTPDISSSDDNVSVSIPRQQAVSSASSRFEKSGNVQVSKQEKQAARRQKNVERIKELPIMPDPDAGGTPIFSNSIARNPKANP